MKVQTTAGHDRQMSKIAIATLAGALALGACTGDSPLTPSQKLQTTSIRLATGELAFSALGDSAQIQVYGEGVSPSSVSWSVTDPNVAAVQGAGVVRAVSDGTTYVVARVGRWTDSAQVTVAPQPAKLVIQPQVDTLSSVGATARLTVAFYDRNGNSVKNQQVSWASLNSPVVSVDQNGRVTAVQPGVAQVVAMTATLADTATVLVMQDVAKISLTPTSAAMYVAQTVAFSAVAVDSKGYVVSSLPITWTSSNPAVATVSNGMVTGISSGSATITASGGGKSATSSVNVKAVPVSAVVVSPTTASTTVGAAVQYTAQTLDASGTTLTNRTISWSSSNSSVATVSSAGLVTAVAAGQATIKATSESVSGQAAFTATTVVSAPPPTAPVAAVTVSPTSLSLSTGGALQLSATTTDASGNVLTGRTVTWSSSAPAVATVSSTGLVTAVAAGQASIIATSETQSGQAAATVNAPASTQPLPVASVSVSPSSNSLQVGGAVQLSATTKDANGNTLTGRVVTWSSSAPSVATVSSTGLVTAIAAGQATINAVSETQVGSSAVSVAAPTPVAVAKVTLAPNASTLQIGGTVQLSATATDANGNVLTGRTVTWSSLATTIASVSATGLVTALTAGSATINASVDGVVGSAAIVVSAPTSTAPAPTQGTSVFTSFDGVSVSYTDGELWQSGTDMLLNFAQYASYPNSVQVVNDPTGMGHGSVLSFHYYRDGVTTLAVDQNRGVYYNFPGQPNGDVGFGKDLVISGKLYMATPSAGSATTSTARKLYYLFGKDNNYSIVCLGIWGGTLLQPFYLDWSTGSRATIAPYITVPSIYAGWHDVKLEVKTNSTGTTADGAVRVWLDGNLVHEGKNLILIPDATHVFDYFGFGYQTNGTDTTTFDEYRYWDDLNISVQ